MSRTLTALFDHRNDAEAAKQRLKDASIDVSNVHIHDQSSAGSSSADTSGTGMSTTGGAMTGTSGHNYSTHENRGFWSSIKDVFLPDEDRHTYEEGVRRGGALLTASVDDDDADKAVRILEEANTIDIDQRSQEWRSSGWDYAGGAAGAGASTGLFGGTGTTDRSDYDNTTDRSANTGRSEGEEVIPVTEETLKVGKREVERGGVRVRSYVVETPVHESVNLREEHVSVERRAVNEPISAATGDAFRERTVEMTERAEEAVVAKDARVVEEVVVRKDADTRTETVDDTVRRTEVEVENLGTERTSTGTSGTGLGGSGMGGTTDRDRY